MQLKQDFSKELVHLEEALKHQREHVEEEMQKLRAELQGKHDAELSSLRWEFERDLEMQLVKALHEEKEKLKALHAAVDNDDSKKF